MNVPQLRFKEFNDEWQSKKLGSLMNVTSVKRIHMSEWRKEGIPFLRARDIVAKYSHNQITDPIYIEKSKYDEYIKISGQVKPNELLITGVGTIGIPFLIKESDIPLYFKDGNIIWLQNEKEDGTFLYYYFSSPIFIKYLKKITGIGTVGTYTIQNAKNTPLFISSLSEQQKIGTFFSKLDDLITTQKHKVELLKQLKHGYLQKLFPQAGQTTPQLRFKGFNDEWQIKKLGNFLSIPIKEKANINSINDLMTVKLNLNGVALSSRTTLSLTATNYYIRHSGQFIYGKQNFFNGAIAIIPKEFEGKATSGDVPALNIKNIDSMFLYSFVSRPVYFKNKESMASGTGSKRIHEKTLLSFNISVPNSLKEQQKISSLFAKLDHLIELQNHRLKLLEELKKGYLQKMFI